MIQDMDMFHSIKDFKWKKKYFYVNYKLKQLKELSILSYLFYLFIFHFLFRNIYIPT